MFQYCTYTTRYQGNLVKHVRIHTGDKPYSCKFCGKRFASKSNHKSHETIHTGQKRLKCPHGDCTYRANTKECIAAHLMRCHGDSSVTLTPRRRKSTKSSTDKSPLASPVIPSDLTSEINFQNRQRQLALQDQSPSDERSNDLSSIVPPWATHAYMQTLLPPTVEVKPTLEELAEYVGTLHEAETLDQAGQRGETPDSVASSSLAASTSSATLVSTPGQQHMRTTQQAIPSISTFIRNRNPADELAPHNNMNPGGGDVNSQSPNQHNFQLDEDSTNHSLNSQPNDSLAAAAAAHLAAAAQPQSMDHSSSSSSTATAAQVQAANNAAAHGGAGEGAPNSTGEPATSPPQGPGTPIDMQAAAAQQQQQQAASAAAAGTDPMALVSDENRSSVLSIELLQVFSKFGLDPQVIVDTLVLQGKLYRCVSCNIIFPEYSTFVLHKGCHGNRHPYQCHFCQVIFPEKFGFLTHFMQCPRK
jgi:hypothetical protein